MDKLNYGILCVEGMGGGGLFLQNLGLIWKKYFLSKNYSYPQQVMAQTHLNSGPNLRGRVAGPLNLPFLDQIQDDNE